MKKLDPMRLLELEIGALLVATVLAAWIWWPQLVNIFSGALTTLTKP